METLPYATIFNPIKTWKMEQTTLDGGGLRKGPITRAMLRHL